VITHLDTADHRLLIDSWGRFLVAVSGEIPLGAIRSNTMEKRLRALLLDTDPDTLITLQRALEEADIDATVTGDEMEACQLIETAPFDLILVGDHPPELNGAVILDGA
jgi:response regulator RpfG family c-di-GMP phosphodiesterase